MYQKEERDTIRSQWNVQNSVPSWNFCLRCCFLLLFVYRGRFAVVYPLGGLLYTVFLLIKSCNTCFCSVFVNKSSTKKKKKENTESFFVPSPKNQEIIFFKKKNKKQKKESFLGDVISWPHGHMQGWGGTGIMLQLSLQKRGERRWGRRVWGVGGAPFHVSTGLGTILLGVSGNWEDREVTSLPEEFPREPDSEKDTWTEGQRWVRMVGLLFWKYAHKMDRQIDRSHLCTSVLNTHTSCWKAGWSRSLCSANSLRAFHGGW